ncbi:MAG: site-specific integrase [bacterium]|nr:site-specific integrase [bacterium]
MATIRKRETGSDTVWHVQVRLKGHPQETATFTRKTDAKKWAQDTESAIREGRHFKTREARNHTLGELVERYVAQHLSGKKSAKDQRRVLEWWKTKIGSYSLADVNPALLVEWRDRLASETTVRGTRRSSGTVNRYLAYLSHAFTVATREWQWLESNPLTKVSKLKEPRGRVRFLSDEERQDLLDACQESDDPLLYPLVVLALSTGARQGELLGLRWSDVDLKRKVAIAHDTKNEDRRALLLSGLAFDVLRDLRKVRRLDTDLVFANQKGKASFPRNAWEAALKAAEIEDFRFHDLRHSAASPLALSGATLAEIAEVLGHKTLAMVKRYSHLTEQHTSKVVARMNEKIFGQQ